MSGHIVHELGCSEPCSCGAVDRAIAAPECPHFGRPLDFATECTICSGADAKLKAAQASQVRTFPAKFSSICAVCHDVIDVDDMIQWTPGESATHVRCAP